MTGKIYLACLLLIGLINLAPVVGAFAPHKMSSAYGVELGDPNLMLLLQHRAVLFGLIGGLVFASLFFPALQVAALIVATVSMLSFLVLLPLTGADLNQFKTIALLDGLGLALAGIALAIRLFSSGSS